MNNKRLLSLVAAAVLLLTIVQPVAALAGEKITYAGSTSASSHSENKVEEKDIKKAEAEKNCKISKEKAEEIAIKMLKDNFDLGITDKYRLKIDFEEKYFNKEQGYAWRLRWDYSENRKGCYVHVSIDSDTGFVSNISIQKYDYKDNEGIEVVTITKDEAKDIAKNFVKKIGLDQVKEIDLSNPKEELYGRYGSNKIYHFYFPRKINGIKILYNGINIAVDGVEGKITNYSYNWRDDVNVPSDDGIISIDQAKQKFRENTDMELVYNKVEDRYGYDDSKIKIIYQHKYNSPNMLYAKSGEMEKPSVSNNEIETVDLTKEEKQELINRTSASTVMNSDKKIKREQAEKIIKQIIKDFYGEGMKIEDVDYSQRYYSNRKKCNNWRGSFTDKDNKNRGNIEINDRNGELIRIDVYRDHNDFEKFEPKLTFKQAHKKILEAISNYMPDKINSLDTEQTNFKHETYCNGVKVQNREYDFSFARKENGIIFEDNHIWGSIDIKTGNIIRLESDWDEDLEFLDINNVIGKEKAKEIFLEKFTPVLYCTKIFSSEGEGKGEDKLIYRLESDGIFSSIYGIDALTGEYVDYDGNVIGEGIDALENKVKDSKYKKEIVALAQNKIIDTEKFELNKEVTLLDAIKMLVNAQGDRYRTDELEELKIKINLKKDSSDYKYLQSAVYFGIIDNNENKVDLEEKLTREKTAKIIAKTLGYEKLTSASEYYKLNFDDANNISKDAVGSAAICRMLGIMELNNGKFRPKDKITMEEFSIIIYKTINNLRINSLK